MTITVGRLVAQAWESFRRERALLLAVGAPFLFLPVFALQLLGDPVPVPVSATQAWLDRASAWAEANMLWHLLAELVVIYGTAVLALLLAAPSRPTVGEALTRALFLLPRFGLAALLVSLPVGLGLYLLILPGLYLQGRLALVPLLIAAEPVSAAGALARSWRLTAPAGVALWGAVVALFAVQWLGAAMLLPLDDWLRKPAHANPFVLALVDGGIAAVLASYRVGVLLIAVTAWRRLNKGM